MSTEEPTALAFARQMLRDGTPAISATIVQGLIDIIDYDRRLIAGMDDKAAQDRVASFDINVERFINARPEYINALKNTRGTDSQADYHRWSGHAEARRQLATALGYTVPHEPGETTQRGTT